MKVSYDFVSENIKKHWRISAHFFMTTTRQSMKSMARKELNIKKKLLELTAGPKATPKCKCDTQDSLLKYKSGTPKSPFLRKFKGGTPTLSPTPSPSHSILPSPLPISSVPKM